MTKVMHIGNMKSGIDTYVRNTVATAGDDFEFVIVCGADDNAAPFIRRGKEVRTYTVCMYRALNPWRDMKAVCQTVRIILREKPDIVHCHSAKGGIIGRVAAWLCHTKRAYTAHAFSFLSAESGKRRRLYLTFERMARLGSWLIGCSDSERLLGIKHVRYPAEKAFVWQNCTVDCAGSIKAEDDGKRFVVSIGRPSYQKNPLLMVEIARRVRKRHPDVYFKLLGVGYYSPMLDEMKALIHKYGMDNTFELSPWLDHDTTLQITGRAEVYLTTSRYEGLPIAVLEAKALGKPVVATGVVGNNDCVRNGIDGYLLPDDADIMAEHTCRLLDDPQLRKRMGDAARQDFESRFLIENRIGKLEDIYRKIASNK